MGFVQYDGCNFLRVLRAEKGGEMNTELHFSSKTDEWETPQHFFDQWNSIFHFDLDACASSQNHKCPNYLTKVQNALEMPWSPCRRIWMNPPYGRELGKWLQKAYEESLMGKIVVCLIPSKTETRWWHEYVCKGVVHFIKGRLKFGGSPFPSVVVIFMGDLMRKEGE